MAGPTLRTLRFLGVRLTGRAPVEENEIEVEEAGERLPATVLRRRGARPGPDWIVLHGVTRPGRFHVELVRFARALAASGSRVLMPEIREWTELTLAPERTVPVIRACVEHLGRSRGADGPPGLVGFSFGAPQALRAAAHPSLRDRVGGVVGFGAYFDLERIVRFQLTGEHGRAGWSERLEPDPYGRWIIAANYLTEVPEHRDAADVARGLRRLAAEAGDRQVPADSPDLHPVRRRVRQDVAADRRPLFDLLAPEEAVEEDALDRLRDLSPRLAAAARRASPELDVADDLTDLACPVELIHGRDDRLIPFTETLRLRDGLPDGAPVNVLVSRLFSHSRSSRLRAGLETLREAWAYARALRRVLAMV